jgi:DNA-binding beta-propeller fold protein YncE
MTVRRGWLPLALAALCLATTLAVPARAAPGDRLWIKGYAGTRGHGDRATALALSPDGRTVFVTGQQGGLESSTVAYDARTGMRLWAVHHGAVILTIVAANGSSVFVTGLAVDGSVFFTVALDSGTGAVRWTRRHHGPSGSGDAPSGIALSPDGQSVFVTGSLTLPSGRVKEDTVAYSTHDGATVWSARWDGPTENDLSARIVASDTRVFVATTHDEGGARGRDYATIAYEAATGTHLWTRLYDRAGNWDAATGITLGPHGASVFVTGVSYQGADGDFVTIGYDATSGARLWTSRYAGPRGYDSPAAITASLDRTELYLTGGSASAEGIGFADYATVALDSVTGRQLWVTRYAGPAGQLDEPLGIAVSDTHVFVTGTSASSRQYPCDDGSGGLCYDRDVLTAAYDGGTGAELWVKRHAGSADRDDWGNAIAIGPEGQRVFVTGEEVTMTPVYAVPRWITIAYDAS